MLILLTAFVLWKFAAPDLVWDAFCLIIAARVFAFGVSIIIGFFKEKGSME